MTASADRTPGEQIKMTVSQRDIGALAAALQDWLAGKLAAAGPPTISGMRMPSSGGLSSTSLLFEAEWTSEQLRQRGAYVARMAPEHSAVPVFPRYDLPGQFQIIEQVAASCAVPLPRLRWNQPDGEPLGTAFFVMDQVDGRVPLDNPPYVFGGWLLEAAPEERALLQRESVRVLADLHAIAEPAERLPRAPPAARHRLAALARRPAARVLPLGAHR